MNDYQCVYAQPYQEAEWQRVRTYHICTNPSCDQFERDVDPIWCALCPEREEADHGEEE